MESLLPQSFLDLLPSCSLEQKRAMFVHLEKSIKSESKKLLSQSVDFSRFVEHVPHFLSTDFFDEEIFADITSLGLFKVTDKTVSQWLSTDNRDYCFSDSPRFKHPAKPITDYPGICKLLKKVNDCSKTIQDLNAALIIVYNTKEAALNFHDDAEKLMDSRSSIATVSFGATRTLAFCRKGVPKQTEFSFPVSHHDMVVMKPGCQESLLHKVIKGSDLPIKEDEWRICISFRKITPVGETVPDISSDVRKTDIIDLEQSQSTPVQSINLIVGDSFSEGLDQDKLGRNGRKRVVNLSKGGATIEDVTKQLDNFFVTNSTPVSKVFICVGANDIRNCREKGVQHLKFPLKELAIKVRTQFPLAKIWFQSLIPLPHQHMYTEVNVLQYNDILYDICTMNHIYYLDCFEAFLTYDGYRFEELFKNWNNIHPNKFGYVKLAKMYLKRIHSRRFNPLAY